MAYYYVKSGGTATADAGRATSARTGSFASMGASAYYDNISDALTVPTTAPAVGDYIIVSDSHSHSYISVTITFPTSASGVGHVIVLSVADANADQYSAGASETTSSSDINIAGNFISDGVDWGSIRNFVLCYADNDNQIIRNGTVSLSSGAREIILAKQATSLTLEQTDVDIPDASNFDISNGAKVRWFGGKAIAVSSIDELFVSLGGRAFSVHCVGCDFSEVDKILGDYGSALADVHVDVTLERCEVSGSVTFASEDFVKNGSQFLATQCASGAAAEYQFYNKTRGGFVEDATNIYRDDSEPFTEQNQKVSAKVTTSANANIHIPFAFALPTRYAELSVASTDTIRIFLLSSDSGLTDSDVWAELIYPDGTNKQIANLLSTANTDPLAAGTALTANTDAWTGRTTETRYQIDLDTSGDVGADCAPIIRIYVGKPSITVYFDTSVEVVA